MSIPPDLREPARPILLLVMLIPIPADTPFFLDQIGLQPVVH